MSEQFELSAEVRTDTGKGASRRLRRDENLLPAIIYGTGKEPVMITLRQNEVRKAISFEAFFSSILTLHVSGADEKVIIKDIQRHPYRQEIVHMDFQRVDAKQALVKAVPLHFIGEEASPGVKEGGVVSHVMNEVEIKCLPKDLPEYIEVDLSALELDQSLHLSDIKAPKGVEITALALGEDHDLPIVSIHVQRAVVEEEPVEEAEGDEAAAEGEASEGDEAGDASKE